VGLPERAAKCSAVLPAADARFTSAPRPSSVRTMSACRCSEATDSAVTPLSGSAKSMPSPDARHAATNASASPSRASSRSRMYLAMMKGSGN